MTGDRVRNREYADALLRCLGLRVVDVGTGADAFLARLFLKGNPARSLVALEGHPRSAALARRV